MTKWEYATAPLLIHATKQILDTWGQDGWELVQVVPGPNAEQLVAYFKRPLDALMATPEQRLAELGLELPDVVTPLASYVPAVRTGTYVYTSGQLPMVDGEMLADRQGRRRGRRRDGAKRSAASARSTRWPRCAR